jgi:hypothetical protein
MADPDPVLARIGEGIALRGAGDRAAARQLYTEVWDEIGADGDALHRCALAHSMADVQADVQDELAWDVVAIEAAELVTDERLRRAGMPGTARGLYPSLDLNLADAYRRLGDVTLARVHTRLAYADLDALGDDGYARMIRDGLDRLVDQLSLPAPSSHS